MSAYTVRGIGYPTMQAAMAAAEAEVRRLRGGTGKGNRGHKVSIYRDDRTIAATVSECLSPAPARYAKGGGARTTGNGVGSSSPENCLQSR